MCFVGVRAPAPSDDYAEFDSLLLYDCAIERAHVWTPWIGAGLGEYSKRVFVHPSKRAKRGRQRKVPSRAQQRFAGFDAFLPKAGRLRPGTYGAIDQN